MRKLAIPAVALGVLACVGLSISGCAESREPNFRSVFLSVPDVEEVAYFLTYEGHKDAGLNLTDGRYLYIAEFDEAVGTSTDKIGLHQIGNLRVTCSTTSEGNDVVGGGFNVIEVMRSSPLQLQLRNIGDIVSHYDEIHRYLEESLPTAELKQVNMGPSSYWCLRDWSTKRARN